MNDRRVLPPVSETISGAYFMPVISYIVRLGEIMILAAAFRIDAQRTDSILLEVFSGLMVLAMGGQLGLPFGFLIFRPASRFKIKATGTNLFLIVVAASCFLLLAHLSTLAINEAVDEIAWVQSAGASLPRP